jgi:hypothetical protein
MNTPRYSALAARLLRNHVTEFEADEMARKRGLDTIARARQVRARRRTLQRVAYAVTAVAAAVALWFFGPSMVASDADDSPLVTVVVTPKGAGVYRFDDGNSSPMLLGSKVPEGSRLSTPAAGGAELALSTGTRIKLDADSNLELHKLSSTQRFSLRGGSTDVHVAKLGADERFVVDTPDAQIEVRGTAFRLSVVDTADPCTGSRTRLSVSEGVVEVRSATTLTRVGVGEQWPPKCEEVEAEAAPTPTSAEAEEQDAGARDSGAQRVHTVPLHAAPAAETASILRQQSDLFSTAVHAKRRGDIAEALRLYQQFISRYPGSALAEDATVARMRLLKNQGSAGRREAQHYLDRYPLGYAREEAEHLVDETGEATNPP